MIAKKQGVLIGLMSLIKERLCVRRIVRKKDFDLT